MEEQEIKLTNMGEEIEMEKKIADAMKRIAEKSQGADDEEMEDIIREEFSELNGQQDNSDDGIKTSLSNLVTPADTFNSAEEFEKIVIQMIELRQKKNNDYGNGFIKTYDRYGKDALFYDMLRKWQRLETILHNNKEIKVSDETLEDTLMDLAAMSINGIIWLNRRKKDGRHI